MSPEREAFLDGLTREMYQQRSQSLQEMTDERWTRIKERFPGSVRSCREDVLRFHGEYFPDAERPEPER